MTDPANFLQGYAKAYAAGAFATPTRRELTERPQLVFQWGEVGQRVVAVVRRLTRASTRRDWTGRTFELPAGATIATHLARDPTAPWPEGLRPQYVCAYRDDLELGRQLIQAGYGLFFTRISAASEMIGVWGLGAASWPEKQVDRVTLGVLPSIGLGWHEREAIAAEVAAVGRWADDFPYYSDGSWDAVSLRGYRPDDPLWGVKPSEMGRRWNEEHPGALRYQCGWTTLAGRMPATVAFVRRHWGEALDRVRLMRMAGARGSVLRRHCDITDHQAGTRLGQMVRFFLPVETDATATLSAWTLDGVRVTRHLEPWRMHYLDIRKPHAANNPSGRDRIHLAVDALVTPAVQAQIESVVE